jgi:hypothetical protein
VTVAGVPSRTNVTYSYDTLRRPPRIARVIPIVGPAAGGTPVTLFGDAFGDSALVVFEERDASGSGTGNRSECVWRGVAGMSCNDTEIRCLAPPLTTAGWSFDVAVSVGGVSTVVYTPSDPSLPSRWTYEAPVITALTPSRNLLPQPGPGATIVVTGRNFGAMQGSVFAGLRALECPVWSDGAVVCSQPPGVAAEVSVTVVVANGLASGSPAQLMFLPPVVVAVEPASVRSGTSGGARLNVSGANFVHPLPMSVWLVRWRGTAGLFWGRDGPSPSPDAIECPGTAGAVTSTWLVCSVPPGTGAGWGLVVVNVDDAVASPGVPLTTAASPFRWRSSLLAPNFSLAYAPPVLASKQLLSAGGGAPALGGFLLRLTGANFGLQAPRVTVGTLPCAVVPGTHSHDSLLCTAPARQVDADSLVRVVVDGQPSEALEFAYDPPVVTRLAPGDMLALAPDGRSRLTLRGANFGVRYRSGLAIPHVVTVGPLPCVSIIWVGDSELSCVPEGEVAVGPVNVTVTLMNDTSAPVVVIAWCPVNWFAQPGDLCARCPAGALCPGGAADPVSLPGYFPLSLSVFVECVPRAACTGGVSAVDLVILGRTGCSRLYEGNRCAECAVGAYRLRGKCASCPNTAWLLFFGFALAILAAVAAAVYLAGKRINMAGLSIGVVRCAVPLSRLVCGCAPLQHIVVPPKA